MNALYRYVAHFRMKNEQRKSKESLRKKGSILLCRPTAGVTGKRGIWRGKPKSRTR
jgi:hypothetical protein